jgi:excinuclease ABC subunit B
MIGRAARNVDGQVVMYADQVTDSMQRAISETNRRRGLQVEYNAANGIDPQTIRKRVTDILVHLRPDGDRAEGTPVPGGDRRRTRARDEKRIKELAGMPGEDLARLIQTLEEEMHEAAADLRFEYAARLRDEVRDLKRELRDVGAAGVR